MGVLAPPPGRAEPRRQADAVVEEALEAGGATDVSSDSRTGGADFWCASSRGLPSEAVAAAAEAVTLVPLDAHGLRRHLLILARARHAGR